MATELVLFAPANAGNDVGATLDRLGRELDAAFPPLDETENEMDVTAAELRRIADRCEKKGWGRDWNGVNPTEMLRTIAEALEYDAAKNEPAF